jgi:transcriptional antiterminator NusG
MFCEEVKMYWYVLFTRTGREGKVEQLLKKRLDADAFAPFIPMLETLFRISGQVRKELKPLFPGYVFIESELPGVEFIKSVGTIIAYSRDIIRFLRYENTDEIAMREHERRALMGLCNDPYCIESSSGIIVGNRVYINEGPLKGLESIVRRIDRHKRRAIVELNFMGMVKQVNVALEIVQKV